MTPKSGNRLSEKIMLQCRYREPETRTAAGLVSRSSDAARSRRRALRSRLVRNAHRIERIGQRDQTSAVQLRILREFGIDVEHDRHLALFARLHRLFGEAEAVDLGEIDARGRRAHIVAGLSSGDAGGL